MDIPSLPIIEETLTVDIWTALCNAATYSAASSGVRAWRDSTMDQGILAAGADLAVLEDVGGNRCVVENFSREIDLTSVGLNGWDGTGSISAEMWVYLWLVAQDPDSQGMARQWAFIGSASYSAPTVDPEWTHKRLISAARIESGWQIAPFRHSGSRYRYSGRRLVASYSAARAQAEQSLSSAVPPQVEIAEISLLSKVTSGSLTIEASASDHSNPMYSAWAGSGKSGEASGPIWCSSQSLDIAITMSGTASGSLYVTGFIWPEEAEP